MLSRLIFFRICLFRLFGVRVYVNWSWAVAAVVWVYLAQSDLKPGEIPHSIPFHVGLYLCLFLIVLTHEFGHALACKSVGGRAEEIVLWPLGGVAYVQPPQRAGAMLWSIAAGPLVNVVLMPLTIVPALYLLYTQPAGTTEREFMLAVAGINIAIFCFNMLPFYPLDGGQILWSLLWFIFGRGLALIIATVIGIAGAVLLGLFAMLYAGPYLGLMVLFMGSRCYQSMRVGLRLYKMERVPRRDEAACPHCGQHPPLGALWRCPCGAQFDTFEGGGACSACGRTFPVTSCPYCLRAAPINTWYPPEPAVMGGQSEVGS